MDLLEHSYAYGKSPLTPSSRQKPHNAYLTGSSISASLSPTILRRLFKGSNLPWDYNLVQTNDPQEGLRVLRKDDTIGMSVTMPYKMVFMDYLDDVTPAVRAIGAVTTVFIRLDDKQKKRYIGANTDCIGIRNTLQTVPGLSGRAKGKPALVLGSGGAARSAVYALATFFDVSEIYIINRLKSEVDDLTKTMSSSLKGVKIRHLATREEADAVQTPEIIVGTVPDYPPQTPEEKMTQQICYSLVRKTGSKGGTVLDMCYMPNPWTRLCKAAKEAGCTVVLGSTVLVQVCAAQHVLWSEGPANEKALEEVLESMKAVGSKSKAPTARI
jgi:quinate dehydrogenase